LTTLRGYAGMAASGTLPTETAEHGLDDVIAHILRGCAPDEKDRRPAIPTWIASIGPHRHGAVHCEFGLAGTANSTFAGLLTPARRGHPWTGWSFSVGWDSRETLDVTLVEPELVVEVGVDASGRWRHPARWHRARPNLHPSDVPCLTSAVSPTSSNGAVPADGSVLPGVGAQAPCPPFGRLHQLESPVIRTLSARSGPFRVALVEPALGGTRRYR
jgi:hypothetical protein